MILNLDFFQSPDNVCFVWPAFKSHSMPLQCSSLTFFDNNHSSIIVMLFDVSSHETHGGNQSQTRSLQNDVQEPRFDTSLVSFTCHYKQQRTHHVTAHSASITVKKTEEEAVQPHAQLLWVRVWLLVLFSRCFGASLVFWFFTWFQVCWDVLLVTFQWNDIVSHLLHYEVVVVFVHAWRILCNSDFFHTHNGGIAEVCYCSDLWALNFTAFGRIK